MSTGNKYKATGAKRMLASILIVAIVVCLYVAACIITDVHPTVGMSFDDFAAIAPAPTTLLLVGRGKEMKVIWVGKVRSWTFYSGPPCYVFDHDLRLNEWSDETGEGGKIDLELRNARSNGRLVRLSDAVEQIRQQLD